MRYTRCVERCGNLADNCWVGWVTSIQNQYARVRVGTGVQAEGGVRAARIPEAAAAGTVGAVTDVKKILENRHLRVHTTIEQWILADELEVGHILSSC